MSKSCNVCGLYKRAMHVSLTSLSHNRYKDHKSILYATLALVLFMTVGCVVYTVVLEWTFTDALCKLCEMVAKLAAGLDTNNLSAPSTQQTLQLSP